MFERWHWTLDDVENIEYEDFVMLADAVDQLNRRDAEIIKNRQAAAQGRK